MSNPSLLSELDVPDAFVSCPPTEYSFLIVEICVDEVSSGLAKGFSNDPSPLLLLVKDFVVVVSTRC